MRNSIYGVGMLLSPRVLKPLNGIEKIQPRMMVTTLNGNLSTAVISCDSPTNSSDEMDFIKFYIVQSFLVRSILKHTGGDMNAQKGKGESNKFCKYNSSNRYGEHLTKFSLENRLTCLNTKFQKRRG